MVHATRQVQPRAPSRFPIAVLQTTFWIRQATASRSSPVGKTAREIAETAMDDGARFAIA
jgi:hypothetical protein